MDYDHEQPEEEQARRDPQLVQRALSLPGASDVSIPQYYERAMSALAMVEKMEDAIPILNSTQRAAMLAKQLKDAPLLETARRIEASTWYKLGKIIGEVPQPPKATIIEQKIPFEQTRRGMAQKAGLSPSAEVKAVKIASIDEPTFTAVVNQPGACSGSDLLKIAASLSRARNFDTTQAATQSVAALKRRTVRMLKECGDFMNKHEPDNLGRLFGSDRDSVRHAATLYRDWLTRFLKTIGE